MALGTVHYYAKLPEELKPDFRPHQHPPLGDEREITTSRAAERLPTVPKCFKEDWGA
jgi:hypothetical protein